MSDRKHQAWNFWSAFIFFGLVVLVGFLFQHQGLDIRDISLREALVITLASYRLTRILVFEKIFKYFRAVLRNNENLYVIGTLSSIATCPWCAGVWVTLMVIVFYFLVPFGDLLVYVLALAGVASLLILFSNLAHMHTEERQWEHRKNRPEKH